MNAKAIIIVILILALAAGGAYFWLQKDKANQQTANENENQVKDLVTQFGQKLQNVPLSGTKEIAAQAIKDNYSDFVSPSLLNEWEQDPTKAPGRLTSSPWPERIEISSTTKQDDNSYVVQGQVIEITSVEKVSGGAADKYNVTITVQKNGGKWQITKFEKGSYVSVQTNFSEEGNLVAVSGTSTLSFLYEEPGSPALNVVLAFDGTSVCNTNGTDIQCTSLPATLKAGDRVKVDGVKNNNIVTVIKMTLILPEKQANLKIETLRQGMGEAVKSGDRVLVNYIGKLTNGTKFDSSYDRGVPLQFVVGAGQVIQGWEQGLLGMKVGEKRRLTIPPEMAYGAGGVAGVIPPNAILIFEVELVQIIH